MDQDQVTGMVFVDFRKAFDVVYHQILIKKLKLYRTGSSSLAWLSLICLKGNSSSPSAPKTHLLFRSDMEYHRAPYSVLSWFLLFVNDIHLHCSNSSIDIFADDTTLSYNANWKDIASLSEKIESDLNNLKKWSVRNHMFVNTEKTKAMLVKGKRLKKKLVPDQLNRSLLKWDARR